jgi:hypothetical protein
VKDHPERRAELDALGFVWDEFERRWEEVRAALLAYQELHGDLEVPKAFVVPSEAPWPEEAWDAPREQGERHPPQGALREAPTGMARGAARAGLPLELAGFVNCPGARSWKHYSYSFIN